MTRRGSWAVPGAGPPLQWHSRGTSSSSTAPGRHEGGGHPGGGAGELRRLGAETAVYVDGGGSLNVTLGRGDHPLLAEGIQLSVRVAQKEGGQARE